MARERYVVLGLARARTAWFREVARWATSAAIPADFVKCVSPAELRAHLSSGRRFSAVLLDGGLPAVDRDLLAAATDAGCVPLVVVDPRVPRDWRAAGAVATLPPDLDRGALLDALALHATAVQGPSAGRASGILIDSDVPEAAVACVTGPGGTGASTVAIALAQELARDPRHVGRVLLADLRLDSEQAMLHDARDIVPGVQELVEAHRGGSPDRAELDALTYDVTERGYRLLLGLRRRRLWTTVRPRAFEAGFASLRRVYGTVVCDVDCDLEGEDAVGSADLEDRNVMARTAVLRADAVFVVGVTGVKGLHGLVRVLTDLREAGVRPDRLVPVVNFAPRNPRLRAELSAAVAALAAASGPPLASSPVFLPRRKVDEALRDGVALPAPLGPLLAGALRATQQRVAEPVIVPTEPQPVVPGSLGFSEQGAADR